MHGFSKISDLKCIKIKTPNWNYVFHRQQKHLIRLLYIIRYSSFCICQISCELILIINSHPKTLILNFIYFLTNAFQIRKRLVCVKIDQISDGNFACMIPSFFHFAILIYAYLTSILKFTEVYSSYLWTDQFKINLLTVLRLVPEKCFIRVT